jgi:xylulokinase
MTDCVLGIDVGTTSVKVIAFDANGNTLVQKHREYSTYFPERGWAEQEPQDWWAAVATLVREVKASPAGADLQVNAIGVSSQAPSFVPIDRHGDPIGRAMIWMDRRADDDADHLSKILGPDRVVEYSRNRADSFYTAAKVLWFKRNRPDEYARISCILQVNGYINYRLTGACTMDSVHASITQLYDFRSGTWEQDVLDELGIDSRLLPPITGPDSIIGSVNAEAARELGLPPGIPVVSGTVDGAAAAIESGVVRPGMASEMTGTSSVLLMSNDTEWYSPELISMKHGLPGQNLLLGAMSSTGASLKWFRDTFYADGGESYEMLNADAEHAEPRGDLVFLPYMAGERSPIWDSNARGVFFGLSLKTSRGDMVRAIMEGAAFALRQNLEIMEQNSRRAEILRITGGSAGSALWNQIKADVLNRSLDIIETSGGAPLGVAILAGLAVGFYSSAESVLETTMTLTTRVTPCEEMHRFYDSKYPIYVDLYRNNRDSFRSLSVICSAAE